MLSFLKRAVLSLLIRLIGFRLYTHHITPNSTEYRRLEITLENDSKIAFLFYKENICYYKYSLFGLNKKTHSLYIVCTKIDENVPKDLKGYLSLRLHLFPPIYKFMDDKFISEFMVETYLKVASKHGITQCPVSKP